MPVGYSQRGPQISILAKVLANIFTFETDRKSEISALRKDPRPYSKSLHGVCLINFSFTLTLTPTITLVLGYKHTTQTNKQKGIAVLLSSDCLDQSECSY